MTSSLTLAAIKSKPDRLLNSSGFDLSKSARFVRKPIDIKLTLLVAAELKTERYNSTGVGVVSASSSALGQLYATLLAYSPRLKK